MFTDSVDQVYKHGGRAFPRHARAFRAPRVSLIDAVLFVALVIVVVAGTSQYVSSEREYYSWDYAYYQQVTNWTADVFSQSPLTALHRAYQSLSGEYNLLFTLPLLPVLLLFGRSRLVYELGLAIIYFLPFTLVTGATAARIVPPHSRWVFWSAVGLTVLTPMSWVSTLRGLPDAGGALFLALAFWACVSDIELKRKASLLLIAFPLVAATLFRRHFAYAAVAFFITLALVPVVALAGQLRARHRPGELEPHAGRVALAQAKAHLARVGLVGAAAILMLLVLGFPFVIQLLRTNYAVLYTSYEWSPSDVARAYGDMFGWVVWLGAGVGYVAAVRGPRRGELFFMGAFAAVSLLLWVFLIRQIDWHYALHFTPSVVVGLTALGWTAADLAVLSSVGRSIGRKARLLIRAGGVLYLVANLAIGLEPVAAANGPNLVSGWGPLRRTDYNEVTRLVDYLRAVVPSRQPIVVAAASTVINDDLLRQAEQQLYGPEGSRLNVLPNPDVNSRDWYPLADMLQAQYVVVVSPFQYHISVEAQGVVKVMYDLFQQETEFARDFALQPVTFNLEGSATARIYHRTRPTSLEVALRVLDTIRVALPEKPGREPEWTAVGLVLPPGFTYSTDHNGNGQGVDFMVAGSAGSALPAGSSAGSGRPPTAITLAYLSPMPYKALASGRIETGRCGRWSVSFSGIDAQGRTSDLGHIDAGQSDTGGPGSTGQFEVPLLPDNASYLLMWVSVSGDANNAPCPLTVTVSKLAQ